MSRAAEKDLCRHGNVLILFVFHFLCRAYQRLIEARGEEEPRLPGLKYSPRQLFWMSTAAVW
jgi:hypothetical protein